MLVCCAVHVYIERERERMFLLVVLAASVFGLRFCLQFGLTGEPDPTKPEAFLISRGCVRVLSKCTCGWLLMVGIYEKE